MISIRNVHGPGKLKLKLPFLHFDMATWALIRFLYRQNGDLSSEKQ